MNLDFPEKWWTMILNNDEPSRPPVPTGSKFCVTQVEALDTNADRITLEMIVQTIRIDKVDDETDSAVTDISKVNIATLFPKKSTTQTVSIEFSQYNDVSFKATGGKLCLSGVYDNSEANGVMQDFAEEEE